MNIPSSQKIERIVGCSLCLSRWVMAPICVGLAASLLILFAAFLQEIIRLFGDITSITSGDAIIGVFNLIEISLVAALLSIVAKAGYDSLTCDGSVCATTGDTKGNLFASLKCKLGSAIIALAGVHLLKVFMDVGRSTESEVKWLVIVYATFVLSAAALMLANAFACKK